MQYKSIKHPTGTITRLTPRTFAFTVCIVLTVLLTSCGQTQSDPSSGRVFKIGELTNITISANPVTTNGVAYRRQTSFHEAMAEIGYVEGENVTYVFDPETATSDPDVLAQEAQRLVNEKVDVIVTHGTAPALIAKTATAGTNIPVVFVGSTDPIELGLVTSLQNTEGNVTGVGSTSEAYGKQLEWLLLLNPDIKRVYIPYSTVSNPLTTRALAAIETYAEKVGVEIISEALSADGDAETLAAAAVANIPDVDAIMVTPFTPFQAQFVQAAIEKNLMATTSFPNAMDGGALLSFNYTEVSVGTEAARYVDRLLRGAKPTDLPVSLAANSLAINLKTANAINLDISEDILQQAEFIVR